MTRARQRTVRPAIPRAAAAAYPPRVEPVEADDPLNTALDVAETLIRKIIASGGETPLRARLARLLPNEEIGQ